MLDHMLNGRFIFGISPGGLLSDAEAFGNLDADRNAMFLEAINAVLAIWAGAPPQHRRRKYWKVKSNGLMPEIGQGYLPKPCRSRIRRSSSPRSRHSPRA
jgi:alkanesulfonate monooxygenase SsuD/methylene tetrahydromethanopterin reductase-like flavin-dependent oxidoreductase (luciferase family)